MERRDRWKGGVVALFGRRSDGGIPAGRRSAPRNPVLLAAAVVTVAASHPVEVMNVSTTGAKLRGEELPLTGQMVLIKAGPVNALAKVAWRRGGMCGVTFDEPLTRHEFDTLRLRGRIIDVTHLTPEEIRAATDWRSGFMR